MRTRPSDVVLALVVAAGFAAVGETALRRASRTMADWNAALVTGMGACAALLFPLSLAARGRALPLILGLMGGCVLASAWRRSRRAARGDAREARPAAFGGRTALPLALASGAFLAFAALNLRYNLLWDGFAIWSSKAQRLFVEGALTRTWYEGETYDARYVAYPTLVPLYEALVARLRGAFDFDSFKPVFLVFYGSMAVAVFSAVRARASERLAAWAVVLVLFVPALSTRWAAGGYADMPLAALVAAVAAAALREDAAALPWLIGALTTVKPEGLILALLAAGAAAAAAWPALRSGSLRRASAVRAACIVAAFVASQLAYGRWAGVADPVYVFQSVGLALARLPRVLRLCAAEALDPRSWGLLWLAFPAAGAVLLRRGAPAEKALVAAVAAGVAAMAAPFLFTTWPLELHIEQAYFRLLAQLAPAAVVAVVLAYARMSATTRRSEAAP